MLHKNITLAALFVSLLPMNIMAGFPIPMYVDESGYTESWVLYKKEIAVCIIQQEDTSGWTKDILVAEFVNRLNKNENKRIFINHLKYDLKKLKEISYQKLLMFKCARSISPKLEFPEQHDIESYRNIYQFQKNKDKYKGNIFYDSPHYREIQKSIQKVIDEKKLNGN